MTDSLCPCGSSRSSAACCARYFANRDAPTAEALMRSRYTAYVRSEIDYILATHDASTRDTVDVEASTKWSKETNWHGLEIVDTTLGGPADDTGIVEFIARGVTNGKPFAQRERSNFRRHEGHWFYVDGEIRSEPVRKAVSVGRNEPCPCGSGKKYKRCHG